MTLSTYDKSRDYKGFCQPRRGLRRKEAALYVGVSPTKFDELIKQGLLPRSINLGGCVIWDVRALDETLDSFFGGDDANPWDQAQAPETGTGRPPISSGWGEVGTAQADTRIAGVPRRIPSSAREAFSPIQDLLDGKTLSL